MAMTDEKIRAAFTACEALLPPWGLRFPRRGGQWAAHLAFMCEEGPHLLDEGRREKAMRWLGFVQGALWARDLATVEELKSMNRPDELKELKPYAGQFIDEFAESLCLHAPAFGVFNGTRMEAKPGDQPNTLVNKYHRDREGV